MEDPLFFIFQSFKDGENVTFLFIATNYRFHVSGVRFQPSGATRMRFREAEQRTAEYRISNRRISKGGFASLDLL